VSCVTPKTKLLTTQITSSLTNRCIHYSHTPSTSAPTTKYAYTQFPKASQRPIHNDFIIFSISILVSMLLPSARPQFFFSF
jgi:hypothetical protein